MAKAATATKTEKKPRASAKPAEPKKKLPQKKVKHHHVPRGKHGGMQLMLIEDVTHVGKAGDVVEVKMGYGRNYLMPRGLATFVTAHNSKLLGMHKVKVQKIREAKLADLRAWRSNSSASASPFSPTPTRKAISTARSARLKSWRPSSSRTSSSSRRWSSSKA